MRGAGLIRKGSFDCHRRQKKRKILESVYLLSAGGLRESRKNISLPKHPDSKIEHRKKGKRSRLPTLQKKSAGAANICPLAVSDRSRQRD